MRFKRRTPEITLVYVYFDGGSARMRRCANAKNLFARTNNTGHRPPLAGPNSIRPRIRFSLCNNSS
jgi:hypothetical protein